MSPQIDPLSRELGRLADAVEHLSEGLKTVDGKVDDIVLSLANPDKDRYLTGEELAVWRLGRKVRRILYEAVAGAAALSGLGWALARFSGHA